MQPKDLLFRLPEILRAHRTRPQYDKTAVRANLRACFAVGDQSGETVRHPEGVPCRADHDSVICCGKARIIGEPVERRKILDEINRGLAPDAEAITPEAAAECPAVEVRIAEMTGRRWRKGKREYWIWRFPAPAGED